uniref:Uncharacterized protein n=1 Tax=Arundo donax TaxID=35708 RepID=A0A0A9HSU6_ARUDO
MHRNSSVAYSPVLVSCYHLRHKSVIASLGTEAAPFHLFQFNMKVFLGIGKVYTYLYLSRLMG